MNSKKKQSESSPKRESKLSEAMAAADKSADAQTEYAPTSTTPLEDELASEIAEAARQEVAAEEQSIKRDHQSRAGEHMLTHMQAMREKAAKNIAGIEAQMTEQSEIYRRYIDNGHKLIDEQRRIIHMADAAIRYDRVG